jgi:hypothetical protein
MDTKLSLILDNLKPVGSDENLKVYALEDDRKNKTTKIK